MRHNWVNEILIPLKFMNKEGNKESVELVRPVAPQRQTGAERQVPRLVDYRIQGEAENPSGISLAPLPLRLQQILAKDPRLKRVFFVNELHPLRRGDGNRLLRATRCRRNRAGDPVVP
jgi:hypothetical protein